MTAALEEHDIPSRLLEPHFSGAYNARRRGISQVICGMSDPTCLRTGAMTSAGLFDVIEHIADDAAFVGSLREMLPAGGRLYVSVPASPRLWSHYDVEVGHHRRYTPDSLTRLFEDGGFEIEFLTAMFGVLYPAMLVARSVFNSPTIRSKRGTGPGRSHLLGLPLLSRVLLLLLSPEVRAIGEGRPLRQGTSILAAASRK